MSMERIHPGDAHSCSFSQEASSFLKFSCSLQVSQNPCTQYYVKPIDLVVSYCQILSLSWSSKFSLF
jgi:hypothetical protein